MYDTEHRELKVFISGVTREFGDTKKKLKAELDEVYGISAYCVEDDKSPKPGKTWSKLEREIQTSQIFILFLGSKFGAVSKRDDVSITQKEYYTARELNKPPIVFRYKKDKFDNEYQKEFYNEVINFHRDETWAPLIKDIDDIKTMSGAVQDYVRKIAAEAIPVLNDEDEAGNFYLKVRILGRPRIVNRDPNANPIEVRIHMNLIIQNKDEYTHLIHEMWLGRYGRDELNSYKEPHESKLMPFKKFPIKILGKDKRLLIAAFNLNVPEEHLDGFHEDFENSELTDFKDFLKLDFNSI